MRVWQIQLSTNTAISQLKLYEPLPQPFGYSRQVAVSPIQPLKRKEMIESKLFQLATANKVQILMTGFMFWMFGNNISIILLFSIVQSLLSCVGSLMKINKIFEPYEQMVDSLVKYKLLYLAVNLLLLGIILYKLSALGLLPVSPTDYMDLIPPYQGRSVIVQTSI